LRDDTKILSASHVGTQIGFGCGYALPILHVQGYGTESIGEIDVDIVDFPKAMLREHFAQSLG